VGAARVRAASLDDLARSYERVHELGFDTALSMGRQTNAKEPRLVCLGGESRPLLHCRGGSGRCRAHPVLR